MRRLRWLAVAAVAALPGCDGGNGPETYQPLILSAVTAGGAHSCGLDAQGAARCWGRNDVGALGVPVDSVAPCVPGSVFGCSPLAVAVTGPVRFSALTAGSAVSTSETCGLTAAGRAYCWGTRIYYDFATWSADHPDSIPTPLTFTQIESGSSHLCAIATGGAAYCLGSNYYGELGTGLTVAQLEEGVDTFVAVTGGITFQSIAVGANHACGLDPDGHAWCWGENTYGQLGAGDTTETDCGFFLNQRCLRSPTPVAGLFTYQWLTAGGSHTCGLTTSGTLYCWGANGRGQLGTTAALPTCAGGSIYTPEQPCSTTPRAVSFSQTPPALSSATAGGAHTCGLSVDGDLYCWGADDYGQLGVGGSGGGGQPRHVSGYFFAVSAGYEHTCAIKAADEAYCWGSNESGQLGDGTFLDRSRPTAVRRPS